VDVITSGREDHLMADTQSKTSSKAPTPDKPAAETTTRQSAPLAAPSGEIPLASPGPDLSGPIPMQDGRIVPTPGDPRTEPVATAAQSWVPGRVGPATIAEDATSAQPLADDDAREVVPGEVRTDTAEGLGRVPVVDGSDDPTGDALNRLADRVEAHTPSPHGTARA
jgi:hypothetical protein